MQRRDETIERRSTTQRATRLGWDKRRLEDGYKRPAFVGGKWLVLLAASVGA